MKNLKLKLKKTGSGVRWTQKDQKLLRLNLEIYQRHPGEPSNEKMTAQGDIRRLRAS